MQQQETKTQLVELVEVVVATIPKKGFVWNPLRKFPRNMSCVCGSGKKFKSCCESKIPKVVKEEHASVFKKIVELAGR